MSTPAQFLTIAEFKTLIGKESEKAVVIRSPKTQKLFLAIGSSYYKVQQNIDSTLPMRVLIPEDSEANDACLTNVKEQTDNVLFTVYSSGEIDY